MAEFHEFTRDGEPLIIAKSAVMAAHPSPDRDYGTALNLVGIAAFIFLDQPYVIVRNWLMGADGR